MSLFSRSRPTTHRSARYSRPGRTSFMYTATEQPVRTGARFSSAEMVRHRKRRLPTLIALIIITGSILFSTTVSSQPSISLVSGQAPIYRSLEEYSDAASTILEQKLAYKTKFTINTKEIEDALLEKYPELAAVAIRLPLIGRRPTLIVEQKSPILILTTQVKSFIIDEDGIAISELQLLATEAREGLPVVLDQSGLELTIGSQAVTSETVTFVRAVLAQITSQKLSINQLTLPPFANQLDITLKGTQYYIKTDISGDANLQIGTFLAVRDRLRKDGITPTEYIDVRVEERAFYK